MKTRNVVNVTALAVAAAFSFSFGTERAQAQEAERETDSYALILPFYLDADTRRGTSDEGLGFSLGYGRQISERLYWEGHAITDVIRTPDSSLTDFYQYGIGLDLKYRFVRGGGASPFLVFGGGYVRNNVIPDDDDRTSAFGNVGLGFVTGELGRAGVRIRGEARYIRDRFRTGGVKGMDDRRVSLGVQIPLGRRIVEREVLREVVREVEVERRVEVPVEREPAAPPPPVRLDGVTFEFDSAQLTPNAMNVLRRVAESLRGQPGVRVEIAGHTDNVGSADYNQSLSQRRAESVVNFLVSEGVDRGRLTARGYGETQPEADNSTADGRSRNRRVEMRRLN